MQFISKKARAVTPYTAGEQPRGAQFIKLNTNENPYPPSPRVKAVLEKNKQERHIRGGLATREKYLHQVVKRECM